VIQALIFDFFGVIRPNDQGVLATYRRLGGDVTKDAVFLEDIKTAANFGLVADADEQIAARLGVPVERWFEEMGTAHNDHALLEFIRAKRAEGFKTGLLSNADAHMLSVYFTPAELQQYFDAALLSGDVGVAKPAAMFYRLMCDKLDVAPKACVMIDDRPEFCAGARYIGMQAIEYKHFDQLQQELAQLLSSDNAQQA